MRGRFLELSLKSDDIIASLAFYRTLGFSELLSNDVLEHPYAVCGDGRICVGLHDNTRDPVALSFVLPGLAEALAGGVPEGLTPSYTRLGEDDFHEAGFIDSDGQDICFIEARTFSPPAFAGENQSHLGYFEGLLLPSRDLAEAAARWERMGFVALGEAQPESAGLVLTSDHLNLHLRPRAQLREPALLFTGVDLGQRVASLKQRDVDFELEVADAIGVRLRTPEGLLIYLQEDGEG